MGVGDYGKGLGELLVLGIWAICAWLVAFVIAALLGIYWLFQHVSIEWV